MFYIVIKKCNFNSISYALPFDLIVLDEHMLKKMWNTTVSIIFKQKKRIDCSNKNNQVWSLSIYKRKQKESKKFGSG